MTADHDLSEFPENTLLSLLVIDIYADYDDVTIIYDRPFMRDLKGIELKAETGDLIFEFDGGKVSYGEPIDDEIIDTMEVINKIMLIQMDMDTNEIVMGMEVPFKIVE